LVGVWGGWRHGQARTAAFIGVAVVSWTGFGRFLWSVMMIVLTPDLRWVQLQPVAACRASSCLDARRTLVLDGTRRAQRSYPWTGWDWLAPRRSLAAL